jgi:hypothetical protein
MSRWVLIIVVIILVGSGIAVALDGSGTQEDPWRIQSLADFDEFAAGSNYWDDYTRLETDVNLAGRIYTDAVVAPYFNPFTGIFDGNDHKIFHLTIYGGVGNDYLGLFGKIYQGEVINLGLEGGSVNAIHPYSYPIGGLVGMNDGSIFNCYSTGDANGYGDIGGLVGGNNGTISDCYSTGNVNGTDRVGGLVGHNNGSISKSYTTVDVGGVDGVGGLVGINANGSLLNCYSTGNVNGYKFVGGLAGDNFISGSISNCYSISDVNGTDKVGGLLGHNFVDSWVSNCFCDTDTQTHGVTESIGFNYGGTVTPTPRPME